MTRELLSHVGRKQRFNFVILQTTSPLPNSNYQAHPTGMSAKAPSVNFTVISQVDDGVPSMHDGLAIMNINNMEELRLFEGDTVLLSCEGAESLVCLVGKQQCRTGCICLCESKSCCIFINTCTRSG